MTQLVYSEDGSTLLECTDAGKVVHVDEGCRIIGYKAFMYARDLESVELPSSLERIEDYAFACSGLSSFQAPHNLKEVGAKAFYKCGQLKAVTLNDGLKSIGEDAFSMTSLEGMDLPRSLEQVPRSFIEDTPIWNRRPRLLTLDRASEHLVLDEKGGLYKKTDDGLVLVGMSFSKITYHRPLEGTVEIGPGAYRGLSRLIRVDLSKGLKKIGNQAFRGCRSLQRVSLPESLEVIEDKAFLDTSLKSLSIPRYVKSIGMQALLTGSEKGQTLKAISVDERNEHFYLQRGVLCERRKGKESGDTVLGYFGLSPKIVVPRPVTAFAPHAFTRCPHVSELKVSEHIGPVPQTAMIGRSFFSRIDFQLDEPECGSDHIELYFPSSKGMRLLLGMSMERNGLDPRKLAPLSDEGILGMRDVYERGILLLKRLASPQFLQEEHAELMKLRLERDLMELCELFAQHGYLEGFSQLLDYGILNKENIGEAVDVVREVGDAASIALMLSIKKDLGATREVLTI